MDVQDPHPVARIIDDLGGLPGVSKLTGAKYSTVSEWKRRGTIPVGHWPALISEARKLRKPIDEKALVAAHTAERAA